MKNIAKISDGVRTICFFLKRHCDEEGQKKWKMPMKLRKSSPKRVFPSLVSRIVIELS